MCSSSALKSLGCHPCYLTQKLVPLALLDDGLDRFFSEKDTIVKIVKSHMEEVNIFCLNLIVTSLLNKKYILFNNQSNLTHIRSHGETL